jgi:hypothetical protein
MDYSSTQLDKLNSIEDARVLTQYFRHKVLELDRLPMSTGRYLGKLQRLEDYYTFLMDGILKNGKLSDANLDAFKRWQG